MAREGYDHCPEWLEPVIPTDSRRLRGAINVYKLMSSRHFVAANICESHPCRKEHVKDGAPTFVVGEELKEG